MKRAIRDAVLTSVRRTMDQAVTPDTLRVQELGRKKIVECIAAIKSKKHMIGSCRSKTGIFLNYKILKNKSPNYGQSSFLIEEPYTQDDYVFCESENTIYKIPKDKFFDGSHILISFLDGELIKK